VRTVLVGVATTFILAVIIGLRSGALGALGVEREGTYAFLHTQETSPTVPVGYSSCRPLRVEINTAGVSDEEGARSVILQAMGEVSAASGLDIVYVGPTLRRPPPPDANPVVSVNVPVLVAFADSTEVPGLAGDIAGLGGSSYERFDGTDLYVTGSVTLDKDWVNGALHRSSGRQSLQAVAMHELGHVLGLGHVADTRELMAARGSRTDTLGPGDRRGLAILGHGPCV
jgi:hypothetical protein